MAEGVMTGCATGAVLEHLDTIVTLKKLRKEVAEGKTALPITTESIDAEIDNQRTQMEAEISKCGSLDGIPDEAIAEITGEEPINLGLEPVPETLEIDQPDMVLADITEPLPEGG